MKRVLERTADVLTLGLSLMAIDADFTFHFELLLFCRDSIFKTRLTRLKNVMRQV